MPAKTNKTITTIDATTATAIEEDEEFKPVIVEENVIQHHNRYANILIYVPYKDLFISGGYSGRNSEVCMLSATSGDCLDIINTGTRNYVTTLLFLHQTNKLLFTCFENDDVKIWSPVLPNMWNSNSNP